MERKNRIGLSMKLHISKSGPPSTRLWLAQGPPDAEIERGIRARPEIIFIGEENSFNPTGSRYRGVAVCCCGHSAAQPRRREE